MKKIRFSRKFKTKIKNNKETDAASIHYKVLANIIQKVKQNFIF